MSNKCPVTSPDHLNISVEMCADERYKRKAGLLTVHSWCMKLHVQENLPAKIIKYFYCHAFLIEYNFQNLNLSAVLDKLLLHIM